MAKHALLLRHLFYSRVPCTSDNTIIFSPIVHSFVMIRLYHLCQFLVSRTEIQLPPNAPEARPRHLVPIHISSSQPDHNSLNLRGCRQKALDHGMYQTISDRLGRW